MEGERPGRTEMAEVDWPREVGNLEARPKTSFFTCFGLKCAKYYRIYSIIYLIYIYTYIHIFEYKCTKLVRYS